MFDFGLKDLIDIFLVAIVLFFGYKLMKKSRSVNIFYGVLVFISIWILVSKVLEMKLLGSILNQLVSVGAIAIIVLFQEETEVIITLPSEAFVNVVFVLLEKQYSDHNILTSFKFLSEYSTVERILNLWDSSSSPVAKTSF